MMTGCNDKGEERQMVLKALNLALGRLARAGSTFKMKKGKPVQQFLPPQYEIVKEARDGYQSGKITADEAMSTLWYYDVRKMLDKASELEANDRERMKK
jgi:hypothetical protein